MSIKFSVVMPCYNVANYIEEAVGDVLRQTYENFELILVEDCSTDNTRELCRRLAKDNSKVSLIENETNQRVSVSRNRGIEAATGDYILFWDSDDRFEANALARVSQAIGDSEPDLVVFSEVEDYYDRSGKVAYSKEKRIETGVWTNPEDIHAKVADLEELTLLGYPWNKAYNLSYLRAIDLKYVVIDHIEDIMFNITYVENIKSLVTISDVLYHYRNENQPRLTSKYMANYLDLQKQRVQLFMDQQKRWGSIDDRVYCLMNGVYFRSLVSSVERQVAAGIPANEVKAKLAEEFQSDMYRELRPYFDGNKKLRAAFGPFLDQNVNKSYIRAKSISKVRRNMSSLFAKLKQNR